MRRLSILCAMLLLGACSNHSGTADTAPEPIALVTVAPVAATATGQTVTVYGAAEPGLDARRSLVAPAEARVVAIVAPTGSTVRAGAAVVRLAPSPTTSADAAKASADAAAGTAALARARRLRADGLAGSAEVETARAAAVAATAQRAAFSARLNGMTQRAPVGGVVDTVAVAVGDLLQTGAAVASVTGTGGARVRFGVDPDQVRTIRAGMPLRISGVSGRAPIAVRVDSVSPIVDPQTKLAGVYARIPAGVGIVPGETLTATIEFGASAAGLSIPYAALLDDAGQAFVFVVAGGTARRRDVITQPAIGDRVTILKGLRQGERVVVAGGTALEDGIKVRLR